MLETCLSGLHLAAHTWTFFFLWLHRAIAVWLHLRGNLPEAPCSWPHLSLASLQRPTSLPPFTWGLKASVYDLENNRKLVCKPLLLSMDPVTPWALCQAFVFFSHHFLKTHLLPMQAKKTKGLKWAWLSTDTPSACFLSTRALQLWLAPSWTENGLV